MARAVRFCWALGSLKTKSKMVAPRFTRPSASTTSDAALTTYRYRRLRVMRATVLPFLGDLSRTARDPGVPEMPHEVGAQGAGSAALPDGSRALSDHRRHPGLAHRRGQAGRAGLVSRGVSALAPPAC